MTTVSIRTLCVLLVLVLVAGSACAAKPSGAPPQTRRPLCIDYGPPPPIPPAIAAGVDCGPVRMQLSLTPTSEQRRGYLWAKYYCPIQSDWDWNPCQKTEFQIML